VLRIIYLSLVLIYLRPLCPDNGERGYSYIVSLRQRAILLYRHSRIDTAQAGSMLRDVEYTFSHIGLGVVVVRHEKSLTELNPHIGAFVWPLRQLSKFCDLMKTTSSYINSSA
jgi:hypothetical protein